MSIKKNSIVRVKKNKLPLKPANKEYGRQSIKKNVLYKVSCRWFWFTKWTYLISVDGIKGAFYLSDFSEKL